MRKNAPLAQESPDCARYGGQYNFCFLRKSAPVWLGDLKVTCARTQRAAMSLRIFLADDHALAREAVRSTLELEEGPTSLVPLSGEFVSKAVEIQAEDI